MEEIDRKLNPWFLAIFVTLVILVFFFKWHDSNKDVKGEQFTPESKNWSDFEGTSLDYLLSNLDQRLKNEDGRFTGIDNKASDYIGMLSIALTLLLSFGGLILNNAMNIKGNIFEFFMPVLLTSYILSFGFLSASFYYALEASMVRTEGGMIRVDYSMENLLGSAYTTLLTDKENNGFDKYKRVQAQHSFDILKNHQAIANYKASTLSYSQGLAYFSLPGFFVMLFVISIFIYNKEKPTTKEGG